jgi:hypothetical protein
MSEWEWVPKEENKNVYKTNKWQNLMIDFFILFSNFVLI